MIFGSGELGAIIRRPIYRRDVSVDAGLFEQSGAGYKGFA